MHKRLAYALIVTYLVIACTGQARETIISDHFDDGTLDSAWAISFEHSLGWTYSESVSQLVVTNIDNTSVDIGLGGVWAEAHLGHCCTPVSDFQADLALSWDSSGSDNAMQEVYIQLNDINGSRICSAGYSDSWVDWRGTTFAILGDARVQDPRDWQPYAGGVHFEIGRSGETITILRNGVTMLRAAQGSAVAEVEIVFSYYAYAGGVNRTSFFGSESVDWIHFEGDHSATGLESLPDFASLQAYPNPFNPMTTLHFTMPAAGHVRVPIYDSKGRMVTRLIDEVRSAGPHQVSWLGTDVFGRQVPSGTYYCRLITPWDAETRKLSLVR